MLEIKILFGALISLTSAILLDILIVANGFKIKIPCFVDENRHEIALLLLVICVMGLILLLF